MILECPSCGTYYDTPAIIPPEGRKVRCAKCGNAWLATPPPPEPTESADESDPVEAAPDDAALAAQAGTESDLTVASDEPGAEDLPDEGVAEDDTEVEVSVETQEPEFPEEEVVAEVLGETMAEEAATEAIAEAELEAEAETAAPTSEGQEPEEEASPPEADYPIGDFSHQGMGPARSPMQEILTSAAQTQAAPPASDKAGGEAVAEDDQPQPADPVGSGETVVAVAAAGQEAPEFASPEAEEPASASDANGHGSAPASETEPAAVEPEAGAIAAEAAQAASGQDFQPTTRQLLSWAVLAVAVVAGFALAVVNREAIVRTMPGTASFYSGLGLTVNLRGLDFENVTSTWTTEADQPVLEVNGEIVNITDEPMQVPAVVFELRDENGVEVHKWEAEVATDPLQAGQRTDFTARIPSPPASSRSVQVKFAGAR